MANNGVQVLPRQAAGALVPAPTGFVEIYADAGTGKLASIDQNGVSTPYGLGTVSQIQIYFVSKAGSDSSDGKTVGTAVETIGQAIILAEAQLPSSSNGFLISIIDGGIYVEDVTTTQFITINGPGATIIGNSVVEGFSGITVLQLLASSGSVLTKNADADLASIHIGNIIATGAALAVECVEGDLLLQADFISHVTGDAVSCTGASLSNIRGMIRDIKSIGSSAAFAISGNTSSVISMTVSDVRGVGDGVDIDVGHLHLVAANFTPTNSGGDVAPGAELDMIVADLNGTTFTGAGIINITEAGTGDIINEDGSIDFGILSSVTHQEGRVYYDDEDKALNLKTDIVGSTQSLGQEFWVRVINKTGVAIPDGKVVYINGFDVTSGRPTVALAQADDVATADPVGITTSAMGDDVEGIVTTMGFLNDLDTSSFSEGDPIFLSTTTAGEFTNTKSTLVVPLGFVTKVDASTGQIFTTFSRVTTDSPIYAQLSSLVDQDPTVTTPVSITFDIQDAIQGITHSASVNPEEITIDIQGTYFVSPQCQVGVESGGADKIWDQFVQLDTGSGFVDIANSNIKTALLTSDETYVMVSAFTIGLNKGDKLRFQQRVSDSSSGMGLKFTANEVGPPTIPATPSIIFTMFRAGGF